MNTHTLTYNETTYNIITDYPTSVIFKNNVPIDWYLQYYPEVLPNGNELPSAEHYRLKNRNDKGEPFYFSVRGSKLKYWDVATIVDIIEKESSKNN